MNILDKTEKKVKEVFKCIRNKYNDISKDENLKNKTKQYINNSNKIINEIFNFTKNNIKKKPITSIMLSLTLGLIIGYILKKK